MFRRKIKKLGFSLAFLLSLVSSFVFGFAFLAVVAKAEEIPLREYKNVEVIKVIDGDTIEAQIGNKAERVRLIGIQAPELFTTPRQDFSMEAKFELERLIWGEKIILRYNPKYKKDKYKRILADVYVESSNLWVNGYLVEKGFAFTYILNKNPIPLVKNLIELENKARANNLAFWQNKNYKVIDAEDADNFIGNYKVVEAEVIDIVETKKTLWIQLSHKKDKGFSLRVDKSGINKKELGKSSGNNEPLKLDLKKLVGKKIRFRGFIDKYSPKYGSFGEVSSPYMIEILR